MTKPKHRRCRVCGEVTARYSHTQKAGAFKVQFWVSDPNRGEVHLVNGTEIYCRAHAPAA